MDITIRTATPSDYPTLVAIGRCATPDYILTVDDLLHGDATRDRQTVAEKVVALTLDTQIVGTGSYGQSAPHDDPRRFNIWIFVHPNFQGYGIGKRLYAHILARLAPYAPRCLETGVGEQLSRAVRFLHDRGFTEVMREHESHLDLTTFDPDRFQTDLQHVADQGIAIQTLTQLTHDPDRDVKLRDLEAHLAEAATGQIQSRLPLVDWQERFWQTPRLLPDGFCVARAGDRYVGQSNVLQTGVPHELEYGYTGVVSTYRNRGIARALKVTVLCWAKAHGYTLARSWSNSQNTAMIRVNQHLGFVAQPAVLWMEKTFTDPANPRDRVTE